PADVVVNADVPEIVGEDVAEGIVGDLPDEGGAAAERGDASGGIGRAAARDLPLASRHAVVEVDGARLVDEVHDAFGKALAIEEAGIDRRDHVDDGVADGENVEPGLSQRR